MWQYMLICGVGPKPVAHSNKIPSVTMGSCKSKTLNAF